MLCLSHTPGNTVMHTMLTYTILPDHKQSTSLKCHQKSAARTRSHEHRTSQICMHRPPNKPSQAAHTRCICHTRHIRSQHQVCQPSHTQQMTTHTCTLLLLIYSQAKSLHSLLPRPPATEKSTPPPAPQAPRPAQQQQRLVLHPPP